MKFRNVISGPIFCADAPDVVIETADAADIDVRLSISGFVWQFALSPVAEQSGYVVTIKTRDILEALIEPSSIGSGGVSGVPVVEISAGADTESSISMSFQALYGSAAGKTPADMARHWLTWRDQISTTYFGCRERLTFFAGLDLLGWKSGSYTVAVKIYTPSGIVQATLASGTIPSQVSYISVDASPASVLAVGEVSSLLAYDLSFSFSGTAADDTAATVESYPLRLVLGAADPRAKEFIYINSLGVEDRVTACGIRKDGLEGGSSKFVNGGVEREHGNEAQEQFEVYSGHLATARSVEQWMEFLKSSERYLSSGGLKGIVIDDYNTEVQEGELCSVSFTYRLSERIKGFHHDDSESIGEYDPTQKYGALVVGDVPDATTPAAEDLFFLKTRLDEFPLVSLSEDYLLLVQSPVSYHWGAVSLDSVKNWIQKTIDHNGISLAAVWASLSKTVPDTYANELISEDHIPTLPQSKVTGLPDALSSLRLDYTGISALIPQAATADNQLADKEFVNSSIATATATFRGTFATLEALKATPADRNDYAFWAHKDEAGNTCYDKYTYDGSAWKFEYRLNNSSFTAAQWGAINSGITGALVTRLSGISDWALAASKPPYTTAEVTEKTNLYFTDARAKSALTGHTGDTTIHITAAERKAWNAKWDWNEAAVKAVKVNAAGSADKLASSSKLWGNAFNGTADVDGDITLGSGKRIYFGSTSYYIELVDGNIHTNVGLYSDKFISARGSDPDAGGGSGASLPVVWASLQGNTDDYKDKTIHQAHIPTLPVSRIDGLATALAGKQPLISDLATIRSNAATAFGWGDHSEAGYLKAISTLTINGTVYDGTTPTTVDFPTSLPANGGNADTVDGLHASSFAQWKTCDDVDTAYDFGFWRMFSTGSGSPTGKNASQFITVPYRKTTGNTTPDFAWQILAPNGDDPTHPEDFYVRTGLSKTWNPWRKLYHEGNSNNISTVWNAKRLVTPHNLICPYVFDSNTTVTGTLVLSLPYGFNSMMQSLELTVYNYSTTPGEGGATKFFINGYNFANGASSQWIIPTAFQIGILNANVRVGYYKNKCCILIGATNTIWHYPKLSVDKVHGTHSISVDSYGYNDWSCTFLQDESEISKIVTAFDAPLYAPCYTRAGLPYVTDNDVAAKYLKLSGGTMARDAAISWGVNDRTDWDTYVSGIRVMSSITANSGAPVRYATGISVMARYSFQIAAQGGDVDAFFIRAGNRDWKKLLHEGNYSSFALPLTGGTIKGSIRMDAPGTMPFIVRNYHLASGAGGGWARSIVECRVDDKNAFSISPFGNYTPGAANNKISYVSLGFANYGGLNLRISETDIKWGNDAIYHAGNFIDGTNYISPKTTLEGYGIEDWVLKYSADSPDTFKTSGIYRVSTTGTTGNGYWFNYGNVLVLRGTNTSDTIAQLAASFANSNLYYRSGTVSNFTDADHPWRLIYNSGNSNLPTVPWNCLSLTATNDVTAKSGLYGQYLEFSNIASSANHGGFIDFHFKGDTEDYTSRIIEDANGQLTLSAKTIRIGKSNNANLLFLRPSYNYIWADVAGGTLVLGTADGGQTSFANSAIFIKGKKVYIGGTETGNNALNVNGVAHATTGIYTDGYISARKQDTSSDIRLKTDFRPLDGALEYIKGTHFTRFRWKDGSGESVGIIAQEEQSREYGFLVRSHGEIGHLTYDYAASTALLGAALQEEDEKVEALKRRVKELENELNKLKQSNYAR